jgi:hypothetical protein
MKKTKILTIGLFLLICLGLFSSCQDRKAVSTTTEVPPELLGTWVLAARIVDGQEQPANDRVIKLVFRKNGTFQASFRGEPNQAWVAAGQGAYSYNSPLMSLHWDSGRTVPLLISVLTPDRIRVHHGREMTPMLDQEPDEIFQKAQQEKGPTR